jgi:hypothetical protein
MSFDCCIYDLPVPSVLVTIAKLIEQHCRIGIFHFPYICCVYLPAYIMCLMAHLI